MKHGRTLTELAQEIERRQNAKADFISDTREIYMEPQDQVPTMYVGGFQKHAFAGPLQDTAHRQLGEHTKVPAKYYDRMRAEAPGLLCLNLNHWLKGNEQRRMVRTLDGECRAFLSDRYHRIENEHIAEAALPVLLETEGLEIASCEITDRRLYIKAVNTRVQAEVAKDDIVQAGVLIQNSETGHGAVSITPLVYRLWCLNGCVINDARFAKHHVGAKAQEGEAVYQMLTDETLEADDRAITLKVRDITRGALDHAMFSQHVNKFIEAQSGDRIERPIEAVQVLEKKMNLTQEEGQSILTQLIEGSDLSKFGAVNAVTRMAQDVESYDRSTELEMIGGKVLALSNSEWHEIAAAA